jgi:DNA-binding NtrC family response regulator
MDEKKRLRVLLVDDEMFILDAFRRAFRKHFEMSFASNSEEAYALIAGRSFDLYLVDFSMPNTSGIEILRRVQSLHPDAPRVLVTAHHEHPEVRSALESGLVARVVPKPWVREKLLQQVSELIPTFHF